MKRNYSIVLSFLSIIGVGVTAVFTARAAPKAKEKMQALKDEKGETLAKIDIVKEVGPVYIPAIIAGVSTSACILGSSILSKKSQMSLASAYALIDQSYKQYKNKIIEKLGIETHRDILEEIAAEQSKDVYISSNFFGTNTNLCIDKNENEVIFYDAFSKRYFKSTIPRVLRALYHINRNYILKGFQTLNDVYEFLGIEKLDYGDSIGWAPIDEGCFWIEFSLNESKDKSYYILEMPWEPSADSIECW